MPWEFVEKSTNYTKVRAMQYRNRLKCLLLGVEINRFLHTFLGKTRWSSTSDRNCMSFRKWSAAKRVKRHNNFLHVLSLLVGVTKVNFMWCVFHNAQWNWSDNVCKLVTDQWRASLGVRDSESCWFTEEIGWERPGDLPRVIEIVCLFASGAQRNERKDTTISITSGVK
jgi:hypothetical protein